MAERNRLNILLVEDSPADAELTRIALRDSKNCKIIHVASNGVEAVEFLCKRGPHAQAQRPNLILLDLNMPVMDGRELLASIKRDENLRTIPVAILTTSDAPSDVAECYKHHCNCYIVKPVGVTEMMRAFSALESFWAATVRLPFAQ